MFSDPNLAIYRRKQSGHLIAFGEHCFDLTDKQNHNGYISGEIFNSNCKFTKENLEDFSSKYEYIGQITPEEILNNIIKIRSAMPSKTVLVLTLPSETEYVNNIQKAYINRHIYHKELNTLIRKWAEDKENVMLLDFGKYITSQADFYNNINHFTKAVYFKMSQDVVDTILKICPDNSARRHTKIGLLFKKIKTKLINILKS